MPSIYPFFSPPSDAGYEPPLDLRWGVTDEICGARRFCSNRVIIPPGSQNQHHYHLGCEAFIFFTAGEWRTFGGIEKRAKEVGPGAAVYIPVGEPHSYENVNPDKVGMELAFYGTIAHRRDAGTVFLEDSFRRGGKLMKQERPTPDQYISSLEWKPELSEGPLRFLHVNEADVDRDTLAPIEMRWLVSGDICGSKELVGGVGELPPRETTGRVRTPGCEQPLYLFDGVLELTDWRGVAHIVQPETYVYIPQGEIWCLANPDAWRVARFFVMGGGVNRINSLRPAKA